MSRCVSVCLSVCMRAVETHGHLSDLMEKIRKQPFVSSVIHCGHTFFFPKCTACVWNARMPWVQSRGKWQRTKTTQLPFQKKLVCWFCWGKTRHLPIIHYLLSTQACLWGKFNRVIAHYHSCTTFSVDASFKLRDSRWSPTIPAVKVL